MTNDNSQNRLKDLAKLIAALAAVVAVMQMLGITCLIKYVTGISCPGCGMTRAWLAFVSGHFDRAFTYHPLFLIVLPAAAYLIVRYQLKRRGISAEKIRKADLICTAVVCVAMIVCYGIRMADPHDAVVVFRPQEGVFFRLFTWFASR